MQQTTFMEDDMNIEFKTFYNKEMNKIDDKVTHSLYNQDTKIWKLSYMLPVWFIPTLTIVYGISHT